ncbi:hypothetical protein [Micromonospora sp. NPDC005222]|uniref:hypothetical protein n=1 Tax=unclassified Micromonospora TaxID=2617518 RepID=UPI0033A3B0E9
MPAAAEIMLDGTAKNAVRTVVKTDSPSRIGRTADGAPPEARKTFGMQQGSGFLSSRQRKLAWLGFLLAAIQAPVSARFTEDSSWLFSLVVALMVATVIIADDDGARRRPADARASD